MSFEIRIKQRVRVQQKRELGRGKYTAQQIRGQVVVTATGETPTPNYKVWLTTGPERIFPPFVDLWWMKPLGIQAQVVTPFSVHLTFEAGDRKIEQIRVRDADGFHDIAVEQVSVPEPTEPPASERVPANSFQLMHGKIPVSYATTSLIGVPIFNYGDQHFMGDELRIVDTEIGQQVTVILKQVPDLEVVTFTLIVPPVWLDGHRPADVEFPGITATHPTSIAGGPTIGGNITYALAMLPGIAESIVT